MKRKNLERAIVLSLVLGSIAVPVWAADIEFHGNVNGDGNTFGYEKNKLEINGININVSGSDKKDDTTAAIIFDDAKEHTVKGNIYIVNTVDAPDGEDSSLNISNNDGLQAINGTKVNITGEDVYIASLGGSGIKNANVPFLGSMDFRKKSTALSAAIGEGNRITVSGDRVRIIGNIDFISSDFSLMNRKDNEIKVIFNSNDSYFYGDINDRYILADTGNVFLTTRQGTAYVTLNNGAEWIYDEIPEIENLELNSGIVVLDDAYIQNRYENEIVKVYDKDGNIVDEVKLSDDRTANHKDVTIVNLTGKGGIFKADIDWLSNQGAKKATDSSDYIFIEKSEVDSTQTLDFDASKANLDKMNIGDKLYFANVEDGNTSFVTTMGKEAVYSNVSNVYNYQYGVGSETEANGQAEDWYIGLTGKSAEGNANFEAAKGALYAGYALGTEFKQTHGRSTLP